jgi:lysyl-tRNA synthetase, class I
MFWSDRIAKEIIATGYHKPYWVDDMFTPSGFAHLGSLRGPLVHDIVYRALKDAGVATTSTYIFNDFDPIDGLPPELMEQSSSYLGVPLRMAPSPFEGFKSFADYFIKDFQQVLVSLGVGAKFLSSWDMYHDGKFDEAIRMALDKSEAIQDIYQRVSGSKKRDKGWLPLQVVCEKCGKLGTTRVHDWDGKTVAYTCEPSMVTWAKGCGYTGRTSPFTDPENPTHHPGKLPWKVDWPAHWRVLGVTIEGAGKDHSSAGGSRDIARELCKEVFTIPDPFNLPYEFFLIGGKKMSSSKGLGLKARDLTGLLPPSVGRFLFTRTDYRQAIEFDPMGTMVIPDLFDEYDRCWQAYITDSDKDLSRAFILSQTGKIPSKTPTFTPRFRDIANFAQLPNVELWGRLDKMKGSALTITEKEVVTERLKFVQIWLKSYAPEEYRYQISEKTSGDLRITRQQWSFLNDLAVLWQQADDPELLQSEIFQLAKNKIIDLKDAFKALYLVVLDKEHGPRAGWLLKKFPKDIVIARLMLNKHQTVEEKHTGIKSINTPTYFTIDPMVKEKYPSVSIGIAIIRGIHIEKSHPGLEKEKAELLSTFKGITTEVLGTNPEVISYRKLYKEMGIDWHSRRPSPEALLRRVVLGKGLYTINTCVDAYNLVVMKHRISVGAFDLDLVKFPTILRYAGNDDEILLLGDDKPTKYTSKEIAYYDKEGGYNLDFNYRDAQRTMVTDSTKNILINVDGIFEITPEQVEKSLHESVALITQYCGGTVELEGVVV